MLPFKSNYSYEYEYEFDFFQGLLQRKSSDCTYYKDDVLSSRKKIAADEPTTFVIYTGGHENSNEVFT